MDRSHEGMVWLRNRWLELMCLPKKVASRGNRLDTMSRLPTISHRRPAGASSRSRLKDPRNEIESPRTGQSCPWKAHSRETSHHRLSMERRNEGGNERQVMRWFPLNSCPIVNDFEVFRVLKQADKVYGLSIGPFEFFRSEKLDRR